MKKLSLFTMLSVAAITLGAHAQAPVTPAAPAAKPAVTTEVKAPMAKADDKVAEPATHAKSVQSTKKQIIKKKAKKHEGKAEVKAGTTPAGTAAPATPAKPGEPAKK